jgi:hypothetical protein
MLFQEKSGNPGCQAAKHFRNFNENKIAAVPFQSRENE